MLFQLGDYVFEGMKLPLSWGITSATNYAQIPIVGGKPLVQKVGEKLIEQELSVYLSDTFCDPVAELTALQLYRRNGNVLQLTGGDGQNYGRYVITDIAHIVEQADNTGYISAISASIKLLEYNATSSTVSVTGLALKRNKLTPITPKTPSVFQAADLHARITQGVQQSASVSSTAKASKVKYAKIKALCTSAKASLQAANDKVQDTKKIIARATQLQDSIQAANNALEDVKAAADIQDLNDLLAANTVLERAIYNLTGALAPVTAFIGSREAGI